MENKVKGMFDGPVLPLILKLSVPIYAGMLFQLLYTITDTLWISRIDMADPSYVGGTGIVFPIIFLVIALSNGLMVGISSLVARAIGENNKKVLGKVAESGLAIGIGLSIIVVILSYLLDDQILRLLGAEGDYFVHGLEYFRFIIPAAVLLFIGSVFSGILQGEGMMKIVMNGMIIGTIGNIILDPVFIFVLKMDVKGAALATGIAQAFAVAYQVSVFIRHKTSIKIDWDIRNINLPTMKGIVSIGLPQALAQILMSFSFLFFNRIVVKIDPLALTSFSLCGRLDQVVLMPLFALASAVITIGGQNAGRGLVDRVVKIWRTALLAAVAAVIFFAAIMVIFAPRIYPAFTGVDKVVWYAVTQTRIVEFFFIFAAVGIIGRSIFQAIGHAFPAFMIPVLRLLLLAVPAVYILVNIFDLGIYGVWYGIIAANGISGIISYFWTNRSIKKLKAGTLKVKKT
jgi:putative MATE family efflux protein